MPNIKLLLKEKVEKLGEIGEIISVKPGYARNYLLPAGLATLPTPGEIRRIQKKKEQLRKLYEEEKTKAEELAGKISNLGDIVFSVQTGESGKLFGTVNTKDIIEKINSELGIDLQRKQVLLKRGFSEIGEYKVSIKLHQEVTQEVKIVIKKEE